MSNSKSQAGTNAEQSNDVEGSPSSQTIAKPNVVGSNYDYRVRSIFSYNLIKLRRRKKLTQEQVANIIGIKRATLASYEEGRSEPKLDIFLKLSILYSISPLAFYSSRV